MKAKTYIETRTMLTPGSKRQFLESLRTLTGYVESDSGRECIMYWTAQLMPRVVSESSYYTTKTKKRCS
jgi:hypothetical protein